MTHIISKGRSREGYPRGNGLIGGNALANRVRVAGATEQTFSAIGQIPVASAAIHMKTSGVVRATVNTQYSGATGAVALNVIAKLFVNPANPVFADLGSGVIDATGVSFSTVVADESSLHTSWGAVLVTDAHGLPANTYTFNGDSPVTGGTGFGGSVVPSADVTEPSFSFADLLTPGSGTSTYPSDGTAWLVVSLELNTTAAGGIVGFTSISISLQEQPF